MARIIYNTEVFTLYRGWVCPMIFITDELGKFEKNIIELAENVGFKECKTIEAIDLFCGISEKNDVLKEKDRYYAFIDIPQYWSVRADGLMVLYMIIKPKRQTSILRIR